MSNIPVVKLGIVAVSRDCFPIDLSESRRAAVVAAYKKAGAAIVEIKTTVENEVSAMKALDELKKKNINALVLYLGNFGPEGPETLLLSKFDGPSMIVAAAEENIAVLSAARGDAYCGMLNASYNIGMRKLSTYIPEYPVGDPCEVAAMIAEFEPIARVILGLAGLKVFTFGPRPSDFVACNAPIKPLFDLGIEIEENSELDLLLKYQSLAGDPRISDIKQDMIKGLGKGNKMPEILEKLAQYELALYDWKDSHIGASSYAVFANKCWPAFQPAFGFVPCFVNGRLASNMIPVSCEVDIYGAISEYILSCATELPPTLLDINNTVPQDLYDAEIKGKFDYKLTDTFMGFHCGNTPACHIVNPEMKYQLIMHRLLENGKTPDITRGTLEGDIKPGAITFFRMQGAADCSLHSYVAQGEVLPVPTHSFGGIGIFAISEMARFYRHVLIAKRYPHHGGVGFAHVGKVLFAAMKMLGIDDVVYNQPTCLPYKGENPFK